MHFSFLDDSRSDIQLLHSSASWRDIWKVYFEESAPSIQLHTQVVENPASSNHTYEANDRTYQQNSGVIQKAKNQPESEKSVAIESALEHLHVVKLERSYYKTTCTTCKEDVKKFLMKFSPLYHYTHRSNDIRLHYSFDYAQQVHFPSDPEPIYFLTPRKCTVFCVNC